MLLDGGRRPGVGPDVGRHVQRRDAASAAARRGAAVPRALRRREVAALVAPPVADPDVVAPLWRARPMDGSGPRP